LYKFQGKENVFFCIKYEPVGDHLMFEPFYIFFFHKQNLLLPKFSLFFLQTFTSKSWEFHLPYSLFTGVNFVFFKSAI